MVRSSGTKRVVITGLGPVSSVGKGADEFWTGVLTGMPVARSIPNEYYRKYKWKSRWYVPCPIPDTKRFNFDRGLARLLEKPSELAIEASFLALDDAGIEYVPCGRQFECPTVKNGGVVLGASPTHWESVFSGHRNHLNFEDVGGKFPMMGAASMMTNAPAAWMSIAFGLRGESLAVSTACSSGTVAIGEAYEKISSGRYEMMLAGAVECLEDPYGTPMRSFDALGTLTRSEDGNPQVFTRTRSGFLFADGGACVLVLEEEERARSRGARVYAEITGYGANCDAFNIFQIEDTGASIERLLSSIVDERKVDYLNAHGTGTARNDDTEQKTFARFFGDKKKQPLINSTKNVLGHTVSASGAFEAAVTALSIDHQKVHGMRIGEPIENLNVVVDNRSAEIEKAVSLSYGFGGHNAGLAFQRYRG